MAELRVVRYTDAFPQACRFYGELLGWPVTKRWDDPEPGCIFGYGDTARIELISVGSASGVEGVFLAIEVDDVDALHDHLAASGVVVHQALTDQPWGHRNFAVTDPTGIVLVFFEDRAAT
jgi:catechol 2,3-dioxygenase-like lactoylglutathione lyase family enzyme